MNPKVKSLRRQNIRFRIRRKIGEGTAQKPRLSVFRSNTDIYVQLIDDINEIKAQKGNKVDTSKMVGSAIAKKATALGIADVTFDRGGYLYHGRVKSVADGAREGGLKF
jgi:large subunit ribosomal protein L18